MKSTFTWFRACLVIIFFLSQSVNAQDSLFVLIRKMADSVNMSNLVHHIKQLEKAGGHYSRVNFTPGNDSGAAYIARALKSIKGIPEVQIDTFFITTAATPYYMKPMLNISVTFPGKDTSIGCYVIGAHYDCSASRMGSAIWDSQWKTIKAPGADDNATGVAAILEMARIFSDSSFTFKPERTIKLVAFGAEESGPAYNGSHHGSVSYAKALKEKDTKVEGMISVDMVGYNNNNNYTAIVSDSASRWLGERFVQISRAINNGLVTNSSPFTKATYSDHNSF